MIITSIQLAHNYRLGPAHSLYSPNTNADRQKQPYLDSDFQSRWFDFGGDTVVRADK
jgi:hypothetical protein